MIKQYYTVEQLRTHLRRSDFWRKENFQNERSDIDKTVTNICDKANEEKYLINIKSFNLKNKQVLKVDSFDDALILRKITADIERIYKIKAANRHAIIAQVLALLQDGSSFSILRTDIASFFENIPAYKVINKLKEDGLLSIKSIRILESIYRDTEKYMLKRGLGASSLLAEVYMRQIDRQIKSIPGVYYYARFVDDMILFTVLNPRLLIYEVKSILEKRNLTLNTKKTTTIQLPCAKKKGQPSDYLKCTPCSTKEHHNFDYLGYNFTIPCKPIDKGRKNIGVEISKKKINKIKTRITKMFWEYSKDNNLGLLKKRLQFLTGNTRIQSASRVGSVMTGLAYNYPQITPLAKSLIELDTYLYRWIYSSANNPSMTIKLNQDEKQLLTKFSFRVGYRSKIVHKFSIASLSKIKGCWKYE